MADSDDRKKGLDPDLQKALRGDFSGAGSNESSAQDNDPQNAIARTELGNKIRQEVLSALGTFYGTIDTTDMNTYEEKAFFVLGTLEEGGSLDELRHVTDTILGALDDPKNPKRENYSGIIARFKKAQELFAELPSLDDDFSPRPIL